MFLDFIFEASWEVCNKVGGIYTVLSTRAKTLQEIMQDRIIFIGPDCFNGEENPYFIEDKALFSNWLAIAKQEGLSLKVGRWNIPGSPIAFLIDFKAYYATKNNFYGELWERYSVDSLHAYGDYDDSAMFSYATAKVVESYFRFYLSNCTMLYSMLTNGKLALQHWHCNTMYQKLQLSLLRMQLGLDVV